jgi:hypothetical protein
MADELFLSIAAPHDEPDGFCLDIRGHLNNVQLDRSLQVHTCKHDIWNLDGIFDTAALQSGALRMPEYDLCVEAGSAATAAELVLRPCDGSALQSWRFAANGEISLAGEPDLCITIAPAPSRSAGPVFIARNVGMEPCAPDAADRQRWIFQAPGERRT